MVKLTFTYLLIAIACTGCLNKSYKYHSVRIENHNENEILYLKISSASGSQINSRYISPGAIRVYNLGKSFPANDRYEVEWGYSDDKRYHKKIDLNDELPEDFKGYIVFSISKENTVEYYQLMSPYQYDYSIELINDCNITIYDPYIKSSNGILFTNYKGTLEVRDKIRIWNLKSFPANAIYTIDWTLKNGKKYSSKFDLRETFKEDFSGTIRFLITESNKIEYEIA